jgi:hypothetical protein
MLKAHPPGAASSGTGGVASATMQVDASTPVYKCSQCLKLYLGESDLRVSAVRDCVCRSIIQARNTRRTWS